MLSAVLSCTFLPMVKKQDEKKVHVAARVSPRILEVIEKMAEADDRTISYIIEMLLSEAIAKRPQQKQVKRTC